MTDQETDTDSEAARNRVRARANRRQQTRDDQEVGPLPPVVNEERRTAAVASLRAFADSYFRTRFWRGWSQDHLTVIADLERTIENGGYIPLGVFREFGKTSLSEVACLWGTLTGRLEFTLLVGATRALALEILDSIKTELESNDDLAGDFPEACHCIRALEGESRRCIGQRCGGERTHITWKQDRIVLPRIAGAKSSEGIIMVSGITGAIRGRKFTHRDGRVVRPQLVIIDDPQTKRSAKSDVQCYDREQIIKRDILGLKGGKKKLAVIMPCTVIRADDVADRFLNPELNPTWTGHRFRMLYKFPTNTKLWDEYADLRTNEIRNGGDGSQATEFYAANREAMDAGAVMAWPERMNDGDLSGIQFAMNLYIEDPATFAAEYQNEPQDETDRSEQLEASELAKRCNGLERWRVPAGAEFLTCGMDVGAHVIWYVVCAWTKGFDGWVIDYGSYPEQGRGYFTKNEVAKLRTLGRAHPGGGDEAALLAGLRAAEVSILGRPYQQEGGPQMFVSRLLMDSGYKPERIFEACRMSERRAVIMPSKGVYIGARHRPWSEYTQKPGGQLGFHWEVPPVASRRGMRVVDIDVNFWKSFVAHRLTLSMGDKTALTLFGSAKQDHRMLCDHLTAEKRFQTEGRGRTVEEWTQLPGKDNDLFDCLVMAAAGASHFGAGITAVTAGLVGTPGAGGKKAPAAKDDAKRKREAFEARRRFGA